jgi:hypothetical protein
MMDGLPKSARIGAHDVRLTGLSGQEDDENFGLFRHNTLVEIALSSRIPCGTVAAATLIHEITHALLTYAGVEDDRQEQICEVVGNGFAQIIRDNPELIAWMQKTVKK